MYGVVLVNCVLFVFILKAVYSTNSSKQPDKTDRIARVRQAAAVMVSLIIDLTEGGTMKKVLKNGRGVQWLLLLDMMQCQLTLDVPCVI